jgi:hypothetical protein
MYSIHPKMSEFFCTACGLQLANLHSYQAHLKTKRHHRKANNVGFEYPCCCSKVYKSRQARYLHRVKCNVYQEFKKKKLANSTTATTTTSSTVENHDHTQLLLEKDARIELLEKDARIKELEHKLEIAELKEKFTKVTNNDNSKNKTINNITNNITVNEFGSEKKEYISLKKKIQYIKEIYKCIPKYLEEIHFNPKHPENQNVKWPNKKEDLCQVIENSKWVYKDKDDTYSRMKDKAFDDLSGTYREHINRFEPRKQDRFEEFAEKYEAENKKLNKDLDKDIDVLFLNAKNSVK